jgi:hypothetical protein
MHKAVLRLGDYAAIFLSVREESGNDNNGPNGILTGPQNVQNGQLSVMH